MVIKILPALTVILTTAKYEGVKRDRKSSYNCHLALAAEIKKNQKHLVKGWLKVR